VRGAYQTALKGTSRAFWACCFSSVMSLLLLKLVPFLLLLLLLLLGQTDLSESWTLV